jgi:hypothetical protein
MIVKYILSNLSSWNASKWVCPRTGVNSLFAHPMGRAHGTRLNMTYAAVCSNSQHNHKRRYHSSSIHVMAMIDRQKLHSHMWTQTGHDNRDPKIALETLKKSDYKVWSKSAQKVS